MGVVHCQVVDFLSAAFRACRLVLSLYLRRGTSWDIATLSEELLRPSETLS